MRKLFLMGTFLMFIHFGSLTLWADGTQPPGSGTESDPYQVSNLDHLMWITTNSSSWGSYFEQTADIDASTASSWNSGAGMVPIGNTTTKFSGSYDGQGHTIDTLYIDRSSTEYIGFFGYLEGATVQNLGITIADITGKKYVGGLAGFQANTTINNCYSTGTVSGTNDNVGGIVGYSTSSSNINNSHSSAAVAGNGSIGGLIGENRNNSTINRSYSTGAVSNGSDYYTGGLAGFNDATINDSYSSGTVSSNSHRVGGLTGMQYIYGEINNCYSTGNVDCDGAEVGGLVGNNMGYVNNSFWDTETSGRTWSDGGTGKTTARMKVMATFTDTDSAGLSSAWDFEINPYDDSGNNNYWDLDNENGIINDGYPFLSWQNGDSVAIADLTAPISADITMTIDEDETYTFSTADFSYADNITSSLQDLKITTLESAGSLQNGGVDVVANEVVSDVTQLTFTPGTDENGFPYATFQFQVNDEVGYWSADYTVTFNVYDRPSGIGTEGDPYQVSNLDHLIWINTHSSSWGSYFEQTADIDASATSSWNSGAGFPPIGNSSTNFTGSYDGQGHTIDTLYIDRSSTEYIGFFGYLEGATVQNLGITIADITGKKYVGGLAGFQANTTINNCYSTGTVSGASSEVGGLVGYNTNSSNITNSHSSAAVAGNGSIGGLIGENRNNSTINRSYSTGAVSNGSD